MSENGINKKTDTDRLSIISFDVQITKVFNMKPIEQSEYADYCRELRNEILQRFKGRPIDFLDLANFFANLENNVLSFLITMIKEGEGMLAVRGDTKGHNPHELLVKEYIRFKVDIQNTMLEELLEVARK